MIRDQQLAFAQDISFIVGKPSLEVLGTTLNGKSVGWHSINVLSDLARITPSLPSAAV